MADKQPNTPSFNLPQRTITVTGMLTARMCQNTVRVSRLEQRSIQIAMAPPQIRDAGNRAMSRLNQAFEQFEAELAQIEKELQGKSRASNDRRAPTEQRPKLSRKGNDKAAQPAKSSAPAKPANQAKAPATNNGQQSPAKAEQTGKATVQAPAPTQPQATVEHAAVAKTVPAASVDVVAVPVAATAPANLNAL